MEEYLSLFSEWRRKAKDKVKEIEEKINFSEKIEQTTKLAEQTLRKGGEFAKEASEQIPTAITSAAHYIKEEFQRIDKNNLKENFKQTAEETTKWSGEAARAGANRAAQRAGDFYYAAKKYYTRAEDAYNIGAQTTQASIWTVQKAQQIKEWVENNPGKSILIGLSAIAGIRAGSTFPELDKIVFGSNISKHWLFHSAIPSYLVNKSSEKFINYLKNQEKLKEEGNLSEAEQKQINFQRSMAKYIGAPLLGAFSIALGTKLIADIFSPGNIVGFPISIILGGNPVLETIWLFGNGVVCIYNGYQLMMIVLEPI